MLRLMLMSLAAAIVLLGFALPFFKPSASGYAGAAVLIATGALLLWRVEHVTRWRLRRDNRLNRLLNTDDGDGDGRD